MNEGIIKTIIGASVGAFIGLFKKKETGGDNKSVNIKVKGDLSAGGGAIVGNTGTINSKVVNESQPYKKKLEGKDEPIK
jgi:hypothetical protein